MGRKVNVDDLVGSAEIARRLGVKRHNLVSDWVRRYPDFPKPVTIVGTTKVWDWAAIQDWARTTGR